MRKAVETAITAKKIAILMAIFNALETKPNTMNAIIAAITYPIIITLLFIRFLIHYIELRRLIQQRILKPLSMASNFFIECFIYYVKQ